MTDFCWSPLLLPRFWISISSFFACLVNFYSILDVVDPIVDCYFYPKSIDFCSSWQLNYWLVNTHLLNNPVAILDVYPRRMKTYIHTETCTQIFTAVLFIIVPNWKQPKCTSTVNGEKETVVPSNHGAIKSSKQFLYATSWVDLKGIILSEKGITKYFHTRLNFCNILKVTKL